MNKMENKVTSYETSTKLARLGFESKNFSGAWLYDPDNPQLFNYQDTNFLILRRLEETECEISKAYDCHDLFMWLSDLDSKLGPKWLSTNYSNKVFLLCEDYDVTLGKDAAPQEALAKGVIKILEEKERYG